MKVIRFRLNGDPIEIEVANDHMLHEAILRSLRRVT